MKNNKGMGMVQLVIVIAIIIAIVVVGLNFARNKYYEAKVQTIKTDMLQVQWKLKDYIDKQTAKGEEKKYAGTKLNEMQDETLIKEFLSKDVIDESEYEKYYVLNDEALKTTGLTITNYENSYFLINYDNYEIIVTKGCQYADGTSLYKLSEIEVEDKEENNQENIEINEPTDSEEIEE